MPELFDILTELAAREPIFHRPEHGTSRADWERMTTEDFWEVGASGRVYDRAFVLDELERRQTVHAPDIWKTSGFQCRPLGPDFYLLTYNLVQNNERRTRRSTIWQLSPVGWKIVFHQGTIVELDAGH